MRRHHLFDFIHQLFLPCNFNKHMGDESSKHTTFFPHGVLCIYFSVVLWFFFTHLLPESTNFLTQVLCGLLSVPCLVKVLDSGMYTFLVGAKKKTNKHQGGGEGIKGLSSP